MITPQQPQQLEDSFDKFNIMFLFESYCSDFNVTDISSSGSN